MILTYPYLMRICFYNQMRFSPHISPKKNNPPDNPENFRGGLFRLL